MQWFSASHDEIKETLKTDFEVGLTTQQVQQAMDTYGRNELRGAKPKTLLQRFFAQFADFMVIILIIAAIISLVLAFTSSEGDFVDPIIIMAIVILNAIMGVAQESKAEKALDALKQMSAPHAKVIRDGSTQVIDAALLVPGDIVLLEAGDFIPADGRIITASSLKCEESALTGESLPVEKRPDAVVPEAAPLGDRLNMVYTGCSVTYGHGVYVVTGTGMTTEMGRIAGLLSGESEGSTPLQKKLSTLGKYLGILALVICALIFLLGLFTKQPIVPMFMTAVSLAVAAIPEGLPAIVTVVLAMGVSKMVKENAIVRRLPAVETLGSASIICSDKTGTLTQNKMTLTKAWIGGSGFEEITDHCTSPVVSLLRLSSLCCDASIQYEGDSVRTIGDPTEVAIVAAAEWNGQNKAELTVAYPRVAELPFDSDRKLMTTVNVIGGKPVAIVKGAFDVISKHCVDIPLEEAQKANDEMASQALRVLGVAFKNLETVPALADPAELEEGLTFLGLLGMIDPPRPESKQAVATCIRAGIKPIMITGDHVVTARAIAKDLGILKEESEAITGAELAKLSDEELSANIRSYSVYARVSPEDKIRIVKAWQNAGEIVSMTGDGVNDAPALKAADIGCAMGITGTDVAKGAADMILTDDNFTTIVVAVREGRGIYDNIKKCVQFLLSCNLAEIMVVLVAMLLGWGTPLLAIQLLLINLVTDGLPALALGMEKAEPDIMERKPKPKNEGLFAQHMWLHTLLQGAMLAVLTLVGYWFGRFHLVGGTVSTGQTMAFLVLAVSQLFHVFNIKSSHSVFSKKVFENRYLIGAFFVSFAITALVAFLPPLAGIFKLETLTGKLYGITLALSIAPIAVVEIVKLFTRLFSKRKAA